MLLHCKNDISYGKKKKPARNIIFVTAGKTPVRIKGPFFSEALPALRFLKHTRFLLLTPSCCVSNYY